MRTFSLPSAVIATAMALALAACAPDAGTSSPTPDGGAENGPVAPLEIREPAGDFANADVAAGIRVAFPQWPEMSDDEIVATLNAGCDGLDRAGEPDDGVQAIRSHGVSTGDAAFGLLSAITSYCPEHSNLLGGPE